MRLLLMHNAQLTINEKELNNLQTSLWITSFKGHTQIVQLLLGYQANPNLAKGDGYSPLYAASQEGHTEIVRLLLTYGAQVNAENNPIDKSTSLRMACINNHVNVVKLLLEQGAEVNTMDSAEQTPLWIAACKGHTEIVRLLLQYGANPDLAKKGLKPIDVTNNNEIKLLLIPNSQECAICCDVKTNLLTCIHCNQLLCKDCAQNWIGANFTYITDYYRDLNNPERTIHEWQVRNDSCPYCKQKITSEELQRMINSAGQNKK